MRVSERRRKLAFSIPNRESNERHDARIDGRVAFEVDEISMSNVDRRSNLKLIVADEQPLQAHLLDKPAKEPSAKESGVSPWLRKLRHRL